MNRCNILFTSSGRRVSLIRLFARALQGLGAEGCLVSADIQQTAPTRFVTDAHELVPRVTDPSYTEAIKDICIRYQIDLLVPLIDTELHLLAPHREAFANLGTRLLVSSPAVNEICIEKHRTHEFFEHAGIRSPLILDVSDLYTGKRSFPVLLKPANGSGSEGVTVINNIWELEFFLDYVPHAMVQELITGPEYTLDVLTGFDGCVRCIVPRRRLETRSGEISKGATEKHLEIISAGKRVVEALPGPAGPITVQCFLTTEGEVVFIEINPRFGGGFPLSAAAGADFPRWIVEWVLGRDPDIDLLGWQDGLYMLRYDEGFFVPEQSIS